MSLKLIDSWTLEIPQFLVTCETTASLLSLCHCQTKVKGSIVEGYPGVGHLLPNSWVLPRRSLTTSPVKAASWLEVVGGGFLPMTSADAQCGDSCEARRCLNRILIHLCSFSSM